MTEIKVPRVPEWYEILKKELEKEGSGSVSNYLRKIILRGKEK